MPTQPFYLVRHGAMGTVEQVGSSVDRLERGQRVVLTTQRGQELGEVLGPVRTLAQAPAQSTDLDLQAAARATERKSEWFALCEKIFGEGEWPIEVVDIEPLLDPRRAVIYYLGPFSLEADGLYAAIQEQHCREMVFQPLGVPASASTESCGTGGGCGSCGPADRDGQKSGGCGSSAGCGSCAVATKVRQAK